MTKALSSIRRDGFNLKLITTKAVAGLPLRLGECNVKRLSAHGAAPSAGDRMKLLTSALVLALSLFSVSIPIATAQPIPCDNGTGYLDPSGRFCRAKPSGPTGGCDPYSSNGALGCWGGNWTDEPASSPSTGSQGGSVSLSLAEQQFVNDMVNTYGIRPPGSLQDFAKDGWRACQMLQTMSNNEVVSELYQTSDLSVRDLEVVVDVAQNRLC